MNRNFIFILLTVSSFFTKAQSITPACDSIYKSPEVPAKYDNMKAMRFISDRVSSVVHNCAAGDTPPGKLYLRFIINASGQVTEVEFIKPDLSLNCKTKLRAELLNMPGWQPAQHQGKAVCSEVNFPIGCLKWQ